MLRAKWAVGGLLAVALSACASAGPTVVLVRHAEKADDSKDPPLTKEGHERAQALVRLLGRTGVDAIYSSEYLRTQATVAPLSDAIGIRTETVSAREPALLLEKLRQHGPDEVVVVAGHSNTVPAIIAELGAELPPQIEHHEYDRIFLVTMRASGPPSVVELSFGARSDASADSPQTPATDVDSPETTVAPVPAETPAADAANG